jgi:hypothetical protein
MTAEIALCAIPCTIEHPEPQVKASRPCVAAEQLQYESETHDVSSAIIYIEYTLKEKLK